MLVLLNDHDHLAFPAAVKLAKENSLPPTEQKFSLAEGYGNGGTYQGCFDMRIRIFFAMPEAHTVLRDQSAQQVQHVSGDIRIGVLVHSKSGGGVLDVQHYHPFLLVGCGQPFLYFVGELNQLFALMRANLESEHVRHCKLIGLGPLVFVCMFERTDY